MRDTRVMTLTIIVIMQWWPSLFEASMTQGDEAKEAASFQQVKEGLALLEEAFGKCRQGKPFFGGDKLGYLDIVLACFLAWIRATEKMNNMRLLDEATTPALAAWADRFCAHAAVKGLMTQTDEVVELISVLVSYYQGTTVNLK